MGCVCFWVFVWRAPQDYTHHKGNQTFLHRTSTRSGLSLWHFIFLQKRFAPRRRSKHITGYCLSIVCKQTQKCVASAQKSSFIGTPTNFWSECQHGKKRRRSLVSPLCMIVCPFQVRIVWTAIAYINRVYMRHICVWSRR